jgi:FixJ family two-component response regulator
MTSKVYVVEDDASVRLVLEMMLSSGGYDVEADDGGAKLLARKTYADLACIIMDINLVGETGLDIVAKLRGAGVTTPVVIATAQVSDGLRRKAEGLDIAAFLEKPFRRGALLDAVGAIRVAAG